jgi:hypothetical protein
MNSVMYVDSMSVFLNRWFRDYDDARTAREREGGILLPYRDQYFVASEAAVLELGLDPADPDWERIGWDWVRPSDRQAWERLRMKRSVAA